MKPSRGITFYYGGWHTEKYFVAAKDKVEEVLNLAFLLMKPTVVLYRVSRAQIVCHCNVRRGDFLNTDNINLLWCLYTAVF
jgi:hypothetical protein